MWPAMSGVGREEGGRARGEAELFRSLLKAARASRPTEHLKDALRSLVVLTGAERAYLDVSHPLTQARWTLQHGCSDEDTRFIEAVVSRGIVAAALAAGRTIQSPSAMLDERFSRLRSVQAQQLEAVLCVPMPGRLIGVLYLEGQRGAGRFSEEDQLLAEELAAATGPLLEHAAQFENGSVDATAKVRERLAAPQLIGRSEALARVLERAAMAASFDLTVLLTGEPGTGKSQLAQIIHQNSRRKGGPFVDLNCAAIPETLFESELFGTTAASHTGARLTAGKVEAAEGGTLFLDEIGEVSLTSQVKLLQLLESRQYRKLGSNELVKANVRVVAATNAELESQVATKAFRDDLFHRLNQLPIRMPSLRERPDDVGALVDQLLCRLAEEHGLPVLRASPALRTRCEINSWPGNIRQLRNSLQVALITAVAQGAEQVEARHLDDDRGDANEPATFHAATRAFQREFLRQRLIDAEWNVSEVARQLELTRAHIYNLIRSLNIEFRSPKGAP
jgi:Nif-specific regulatory protein